MEGKLPNLLIIGSMKCGTSSLHSYLGLHPDIFMSNPKEIHYFADRSYNSHNIDWYKKFFITDKPIIGCSPQSYTKCHHKLFQNIPLRIKEITPDTKMIYIVRDPIERYSSHILESYHCDSEAERNYSRDSGNYYKTGMYYMQLSKYLEFFNMEQIHIMALEDLQENRLNELNKVFKFLGVKELNDPSIFDFVSNNADSKSFPRVIQDNLFYRGGKKILPRVTYKIASSINKKYYNYQSEKPNITEEERNDLIEKIKDDVTKFRELTGMSFPKWNI